jgi:hypothetical protein
MFTIVTFQKKDLINFCHDQFNECNEDEMSISHIDYPKMSTGDLLSFDIVGGIFEIKSIRFHGYENEVTQSIEVEKYKKDELINTKELSVRTNNVLRDLKITTVEQLTNLTANKFLSCRTAGRKSMIELQQYLLSYHGIEFTF